jgi:hypothetical protein
VKKKGRVVVQFEQTIRIRARLSGVAQPTETPTRFSGCGSQRLKPIRFSLHWRHR